MCILMRTCASLISVVLVALMWAASCEAGEAPDMTGAELYKEFCATCHGVSGHSDGPVALSLKRRVPDLTLIAKRNGGEFPAEAVHRMIDGRSMPRSHGTPTCPFGGGSSVDMKVRTPLVVSELRD